MADAATTVKRARKKPAPQSETTETAVPDPRTPKFRIQASILRGALGDVLGAVEGRVTIPVLANVLIEAECGIVTVSATDLDLWARRTAATADRDGPGSAEWLAAIRPLRCTVPARPLAAILANIDGEAMVTLELADLRLIVKAGRARFRLPTLPADDFPEPAPLAVEHCFELPISRLADALAAVDFAISTEETRYYLNGVFIHVAQAPGEPPWLVFATTDGHRLARLRMDVPEGAMAFPDTILPRKAVALLEKLLARAAKTAVDGATPPAVQIDASAGGTALAFTLPTAEHGEVTIQTKAIDGTFPDYVRVIPTGSDKVAAFARDALAQAVKRVGVLASDQSRALRIEFTPGMAELIVTSPELGEAREELACRYDGPAAHVGFNGGYLRECLLHGAGEDVALHFASPGAPVLLLPSGVSRTEAALVQVLMPMRV